MIPQIHVANTTKLRFSPQQQAQIMGNIIDSFSKPHRSRTSHIKVEQDGSITQFYHPNPTPGFIRKLGGMACQTLCDRHFRRPHFTALFCRNRRTHQKKMPPKTKVSVYVVLIQETDKWYKHIKHFLLKKVAVILEFIAAWC